MLDIIIKLISIAPQLISLIKEVIRIFDKDGVHQLGESLRVARQTGDSTKVRHIIAKYCDTYHSPDCKL